MSQTILFQEVSLPKKRSRNFNDKPLFQKKELTDKQKSWLKSHEETNWKQIELFQQYQTPKKKIKLLKWKLTGTQEKRETCGMWNTRGCENVWGHPEPKNFVRRSKRSCFRSCYEFVGLVDPKIWKPLETLEEAVAKKEALKQKHKKNPRRGNYIDDGQGIATYYSSWLESKETNTPQHGHTTHI